MTCRRHLAPVTKKSGQNTPRYLGLYQGVYCDLRTKSKIMHLHTLKNLCSILSSIINFDQPLHINSSVVPANQQEQPINLVFSFRRYVAMRKWEDGTKEVR